jgi:signal peptidase II
MTDPGSAAPADDAEVASAADEVAASAPADAVADARPAAPLPLRTLGLVALTVVVVDQLTKWWAQRELADGHEIRVVGSLLKFTLTYNSGMAFSRGEGLGPVIGVVALVVIVVLLASLRRESSRLGQIVLAVVVGGAAGNIVDRLFRGKGFLRGSVVDFIQLPHWPVFNVADIAVTCGGVTLVIAALVSGRRARPAPSRSSSSPSSSSPS